MHKRAQVLIIFLWILVVLVILVVSISQRASTTLRFIRYQKDKQKALSLAKTGINRVISEIINDKTPDYDRLKDSWADNDRVFKKIVLGDNENEFATVSYTIKQNGMEETRFGIIDEESKININAVPQDIITSLLTECGIDTAKANELSLDILKWRGEPLDDETKSYYINNLGYACKNKPFTVTEEVVLVKGMEEVEPEKLEKFKSLITVYGDKQVNINTASKEVLKILGLTATAILLKEAPGLNISENDVNTLVEEILSFRDRPEGYFNITEINTEKIKEKLELADIVEDNRTKIIAKLISLGLLTAVSENFRIESRGNVGKVKKEIIAVVKRENPGELAKIVYWHEN